jgi:hypothetical protein
MLFTAFGEAVRAYRASKPAQLAHRRLAASA